MRRLLTIFLLLGLAAGATARAPDIRMDEKYDPRGEMRIVVLPATLPRSLKRTNPRTVSALLSTELLRLYEVLDLIRFEQFLTDRKLTLDQAFSIKARTVVRDSAKVDAIASVEVFRWEEGSGGLPLMKQAGRIGVRVRLMDPFTGHI
ncbi:MAG TPA: hypothetical protein ENI92_04480, partial [Bacteroidetes bacterium]|nr:hypothetical protein [Bacteroidota bacterium]